MARVNNRSLICKPDLDELKASGAFFSHTDRVVHLGLRPRVLFSFHNDKFTDRWSQFTSESFQLSSAADPAPEAVVERSPLGIT